MNDSRITFLGCDCETTGLDPEKDALLEIGLIAFDEKLNEMCSFESVIYPATNARNLTNSFVTQMHENNGLFEDIDAYDNKADILTQVVEAKALSWLDSNNVPRKLPMLGSSVTFDRDFVRKNMPALHDRFHYKSLDATSVEYAATAVAGVNPDIIANRDSYSKDTHRVLNDIRNSAEKIRACIQAMRALD